MSIFKDSSWQYLIPQHLLSRLVGYLANCPYEPVKNYLIKKFIHHYQVDLADAVIENPNEFICFNDFFTRELKPGVRPFDPAANILVSPADGTLSEFGYMQENTLLQAKGQHYSLETLLANEQQWVDAFAGGAYATVYLSPKDYHRVHMPFAGDLVQMIHVPGKLFSVNQKTAQDIPEVFARNERVLCIFNTACGPMAVILVGAVIVASIATAWHGQVTPVSRQVQQWHYQQAATMHLAKAAEMGRFYLGSTAIVLMPKDTVEWNQELVVGQPLKLGQSLAKVVL